jgi:lipoprotein NlpI
MKERTMVRRSLIVLLLVAGGVRMTAAQTAATPTAPADPQTELLVNCIAGTGQQKVDACTTEMQQSNQTNNALQSEYLCRGDGYVQLGEYDLAKADYMESLRRIPGEIFTLDSLGKLYDAMGQYGEAVEEFTSVMNSPPGEYGLRPKPEEVLVERGRSYMGEGQYATAMQDFVQALVVKPGNTDAIVNHGFANFATQNYDGAIADYQDAVNLDAKLVGGPFGLGYANYMKGNYAEAETDLQKAADMNPTYAYSLLWLHMARMRQRKDDKADFAARTAKVSMTAWPAPVLKYFLGQTYETNVITDAFNSNPQTQAGQQCEESFYIAEDKLIEGGLRNIADARLGLTYAVGGCPKRFVEYGGAAGELKRLGPPRAAARPAVRTTH